MHSSPRLSVDSTRDQCPSKSNQARKSTLANKTRRSGENASRSDEQSNPRIDRNRTPRLAISRCPAARHDQARKTRSHRPLARTVHSGTRVPPDWRSEATRQASSRRAQRRRDDRDHGRRRPLRPGRARRAARRGLEVEGSVGVRAGEWFQHEHLDGQIGVDVVVAHEPDHSASRQFLDLAADVLLHDPLPASARSTTASPSPASASVRSPRVRVSCSTTKTPLSPIVVFAFVGPRPVVRRAPGPRCSRSRQRVPRLAVRSRVSSSSSPIHCPPIPAPWLVRTTAGGGVAEPSRLRRPEHGPCCDSSAP